MIFDSTGTKRIVYKSEAFVTGLTVTAYIWSPSLVRSALQTFTELSDGLYYLDYNFTVSGTYVGLYMEGGVKTVGGSIRILNTAADVVTELMADTGFTQGGTMTFEKLQNILAAWIAGEWRDKPGSSTIKELLDPDDGTTVILEMTIDEDTPYREITVKI